MFFRIGILLMFTINSIFACAGGFWPDDYEFNFLHKRAFGFSNVDGDLNFSGTYNELVRETNNKAKEINLSEWQKEFGKDYTKKQIEEFLYEKKNLYKIKNKEIVKYIKFVETQEPYVNSWRNYYFKFGYNGVKIKKSDVDTLISKAMSSMISTKSKYLKLRYFFLALRLSHYYNKPSTYNLYESNKSLLKGSTSIVKDWIQALYAGILIRNNQSVKGVYEFTKLFDESKTNWYLAFYNFKYIKTNEDWEKLYAMAKDNEERIKFYTIRALDKNANIVEELKNIAKIDVNSKYYDLLLFREILKSQHYFDIYPSYYQSKDENLKSRYAQIAQYLKTVTKKSRYTLDLALAYFSYYSGKIESSKKYLNKAYKVVKGDDVHELNALRYIIYIDSIKTINSSVENSIATKLEKLMLQPCNKQSIYQYTFYKIKDVYKKDGDDFKAFISRHYAYLGSEDLNLDRYNKIMKLKEKKDKTKLEDFMVKNMIFKGKDVESNLKRAHIYMLLNSLKFEKVLELYGDKLSYKLNYNIFNNLIMGNNRREIKNGDTIKEVLEKIVKIKKNLDKNPNSVMDNYLYGTVLYNLSYWGNLNSLTTVYRSTSSFKERELELDKINQSMKYLKKALENSKDRNFRAKITYMLAKDELALYDINNSSKDSYGGNISYSNSRFYGFGRGFDEIENYMIKGYGKYFNSLKDNYADTNYYKELISECANLSDYQNTIKKVSKIDIGITLEELENQMKDFAKSKEKLPKKYNRDFFWKLLLDKPISKKTVTFYNNIAYYLIESNNYKNRDYAIILLEEIIKYFPNRTVAYYNLGDAYWQDYQEQKAKEAYIKYIELMKKDKKENLIPKKVIKRSKTILDS